MLGDQHLCAPAGLLSVLSAGVGNIRLYWLVPDFPLPFQSLSSICWPLQYFKLPGVMISVTSFIHPPKQECQHASGSAWLPQEPSQLKAALTDLLLSKKLFLHH